MTKISRVIEVNVPAQSVWRVMDLRKWSEISKIFATVSVPADELKTGVEAEIVAGPGPEKINYRATITAVEPGRLLQYERSGGPLPGTSTYEIIENGNGCKLMYTNNYRDTLAEPVQESLSHTMERFLEDLRSAAENSD